MGKILNSIANIIGGDRMEIEMQGLTDEVSDLRNIFKSSDCKKSSQASKQRFEVIYKDWTGNREKKVVCTESESGCFQGLARILGRNDIKVMSVRRK